jgi:glycosyltransferase involved in cell wall biosynthesis
MEVVKDQITLARAFVRTLQRDPGLASRVRLIMVGDGPLRADVERVLQEAGVAHLAWLPGARNDIPDILRGLDCFVLPSRGEGISNTVLEAMASGLPVIATDVGGNPELVEPGKTGELVPPGDAELMAHKILSYAADPARARLSGRAGRARVERLFSLTSMVGAYHDLYGRHLASAALRLRGATAM